MSETVTENTKPEKPGEDRVVEVTVNEVIFSEPIRQGADSNSCLDVVLDLVEDNGEKHSWRSEYSRFYGDGENASRTRAEMTISALKTVGWTGEKDIQGLPQFMVGKRIPVSIRYHWSDKNGKWYKNVYLGGRGVKRMDNAKAASIISAILNGGNPTQNAPAAAPRPVQAPGSVPVSSAASSSPFFS